MKVRLHLLADGTLVVPPGQVSASPRELHIGTADYDLFVAWVRANYPAVQSTVEPDGSVQLVIPRPHTTEELAFLLPQDGSESAVR